MVRGFFTAVLLVLAFYALGFVLFVSTLPSPMPVMPAADAIVTLTGGDERLDRATALLEHGAGKRLLITGADITITKPMLKSVAHGGARFDCCADIGYAAQDTRGNAQEAADWARAHDFKSLIVVTARYHMPRALREFSSAMPDYTLVPYPVERDSVVLSDWWRHPATTWLLQREYIKYLASIFSTSIAARS